MCFEHRLTFGAGPGGAPVTEVLRSGQLNRWGVALLTASACASGATVTRAQHRDVLVAVRNQQLVTGAYDWGARSAGVPVRVFGRAFEYAQVDFAAASNPGFNAIKDPPGARKLPGEQPLYLSLTAWGSNTSANLWRWSGEDPVGFEPVTDAERFVIIARNNVDELTADGSDTSTSRLRFAETFADGTLHEHLTLLLLGEGSAMAGTGDTAPRAGVYAVSLVFTMAGFDDSAPGYLLMAHGEEPAARLQEAAEWVANEWVPDCFDGEDNDLDGDVDFPEDEECESTDDWCESEPCRAGDTVYGAGTDADSTPERDAGGEDHDRDGDLDDDAVTDTDAPTQGEAASTGCRAAHMQSDVSGSSGMLTLLALVGFARRRKRGVA